jgi:hypothetical protein
VMHTAYSSGASLTACANTSCSSYANMASADILPASPTLCLLGSPVPVVTHVGTSGTSLPPGYLPQPQPGVGVARVVLASHWSLAVRWWVQVGTALGWVRMR